MVEVGLVHRFVIIIGHHPPDGRSYARGIVSPVKKPGSPPHGFIVSVGQFQNRVGDIHVSAVRIEFDTYPATAGGVESQEQIVRILRDGGMSDRLVVA